MSTPRRPRKAGFSYTIVSPTQHWRLVDGQWRRDFVARRSDGELRVVSLPDTAAVAA